jgi:hypothetical protein
MVSFVISGCNKDWAEIPHTKIRPVAPHATTVIYQAFSTGFLNYDF